MSGPPQVNLQIKGPAIQKLDQGIYTSFGVNRLGLGFILGLGMGLGLGLELGLV